MSVTDGLPGGRGVTFLQYVARAKDSNAVAERQVGIAGVTLVGYAMFLVPGVSARSPWLVVVAAALIVVATAVALRIRWEQVAQSWHLVIPVVDLLAIGTLRITTGGTDSPFTALLILPVLSLGIERGRLPLAIAALGTSLVLLWPLLENRPALPAASWVRAGFTLLVLVCSAVTVSELAARLRSRLEVVARLREKQQVLLNEAEDAAVQATAASNLLRESAEQMASVIDAVTEQCILGTDREGIVDVYNTGAARMLERPAHEVLGRPLATAFFTNANHGVATEGFAALTRQVTAGEAHVFDYTLTRSDGTPLHLHVSASARHDAAGDIDGFLLVATDLTEERETARLKDEFTGLISHELRTPLSSILGYLELIADDEDNPLSAEQLGYLRTVERNAQRLLRLVGDLLFTAQVDAGKFSVRSDLVDVNRVVIAAGESQQPSARAAGVALSVFTPETPVNVTGDAIRLGQACDNLISNAIKFTKPGGRVAVSVGVGSDDRLDGTDDELPGTVARIAVSDTGLGIPPGEVDQLFGRFFRASTATANAVPGVGLGLTITKAIATAHGGNVRVASTPGQGTTFSLEIPLAAS